MAKKIWEILQEQINQNEQGRQDDVKQANQKFNDYTSKHGTYDTNNHTTSIGDLRKAYKDTPAYNNIVSSTNRAYRASVWEQMNNLLNRNNMQRDIEGNNINRKIYGQNINTNNNAMQNLQNAQQMIRTRNSADNYNKMMKQAQEDKIRNSVKYKLAKTRNPNATDEELLKLAQADYGQGNIDLNNRPIVRNKDGSISTVRSMSFQDENGQEVLIPTVVNGKVVSDDEAIEHYYQTGEYLGKFNSVEEANKYAEELHRKQADLYLGNSNNEINELANLPTAQAVNELKKISTSDKNPLFYDNSKFRKLNNQLIQTRTEKQAEEQADEINQDLENGNIGSSIAHIAEALPTKTMEAVASPIYSTGSLLNLKLNNQTADQDLQDWKTVSSRYDQTNANINNGVVRDLSNATGTIGYMVPSILASVLMPESSAGKIAQAVSVGSQGYIDNLNENATNKVQSAITGALKGGASALTEGITGGDMLGKGSLDDLAVNAISKAKSKGVRKLASLIYNVGGENIEELLENQLDHITDAVVNDKGITMKEWLDEQKETVKGTTLSTLIMNMIGLGGNTYNDVKDAEAKKWINEAQKIIDKEKLSLDNVDPSKLNIRNNQAEVNQVLNTIQAENNILQTNQQQNTQQNILPVNQNLLQNVQNEKNNIQDMQQENNHFQYEKSDNEKINNLRQDVSKYFDNSEQTQNFENMLEKIITDQQDLNIRIQDLGTDENGNIINGKYDNNTITINPNSDRAGEFIAVHELTHAIGTDQMVDMIDKYRKSNAEFDENIKKLIGTYDTKDINEEALADVSGQVLGNQEFINNLRQTNPNIFQKIYSEIKYLWHQFTGYKNQNQFVEDLYYKWTQAYNDMEHELNNTTKYHISENFNNEIDKSLNGEISSNNQIKARDYTPKILVDNGVNDLPMLMTQGHIKSAIYTEQEATQKGLPTKNINYHGLGKETLIKVIDNLDSPQAIYKTGKDNYFIITEVKDPNGKDIIVPIQINGKGTYNDIVIDENQIKSVYGKNNLERYIKNNNFELIYTKNKESDFNEGIQYSNIADSTNSILPTNNNVKYSVEENANLPTNQIDNQGRTLSKQQQNKNVNTSTDNILPENIRNLPEVQERLNQIQNNEDSTPIKKTQAELQSEVDDLSNRYDNLTDKEEDRYYQARYELDAVKNGYDNVRDYLYNREQKNIANEYKENPEYFNRLAKQQETNKAKQQQLQKEIEEATPFKRTQYEIIQKTNPMTEDNNLVWIRSPKDIKTFSEAIEDEESFNWGDYSKEDAQRDLKRNKVTLYSSYPIKNGVFVSTSYQQALDYAGGDRSRVHSKEVSPNKVAWINGDEGQYASTTVAPIKYSKENSTWREYLENNFKAEGTRTNLKDILPTKQNNQKVNISNDLKENNTLKVNLPTRENTKPYRTTDQILNDKNISALDAIREESQKIYEPSLETAENVENNMPTPPNDTPPTSPTIDYIKAKRTKEKVSIKKIAETGYQQVVDKGYYVNKLADKTGNQELKYSYDRTMNAFSEAQVSIGEHQTNSNGDVVGKSLIDIFKSADDEKLSKEFDDYLLNKHNMSRYAYEKGLFGSEITATDSKKIVDAYDKKYPQFKEWSKEVSQYNDNNLKDLVNNGMVSEDTYKSLRKMYKDYVPTYRDITNSIQEFEDNKVGGNTLRRATQSDLDILSPRESMAEQTIAIKRAIRMNDVGVELYKALGKDSTIVSGIDFDGVAMQTLAGNVIDSEGKGKNTFTIFQNGEMTQFKISDELYSAFSKNTWQNRINDRKVAKALLTPVEKMSKAQRNLLTTYSVGFAINNPIKDIQDAVINSKYSGATFAKNYVKALYNIGTNGSWYQDYKNQGGGANTYFDYNKGLLPTKTKNPVKKFVNAVEGFNEVIEQAPRLAEYISTIEHGGSKNEALYNAAEVTTNFKRGGDVAKVANRYGANFLNASIQGLDKNFRNLTGQNGWKGYAQLLAKATMYQIAPAIVNGLLLGDDDDYDDLPEYTKDNYFLFKMDNGKFFRIPKGRASSVVGGIARRILETTQGKEVDWGSLVDTASNQVAPNNPLTDNIFSPIIQANNNKTWYGGTLVSSRLQKLPVAEQYDEKTDEASKIISKTLNKLPDGVKKTINNIPIAKDLFDIASSPKKLNYVIDQYSGGVGDVLLPTMTPYAENNILEDKFTTDSVMKNKNVSKYYSKVEELEKLKNSGNATDEDKLKYQYFTDSSSDLADLYNKEREVENSKISDKEKKEKVREIQKQINDTVENKLNSVDNVEKHDLYATVGNEQYYKNTNTKTGEQSWKQLSDEEKEKTKNISLSTFADYKNRIAQETIKERKSGKIEQDDKLTNKSKMKLLENSNYSDKDKTELYENFVKSKDDFNYDVMKSAGININEILDYKQQEFKGDKEDDGTLSGKTVKGSKKDKTIDYLNTMDVTGKQRLLLYAMGGNSLSRSERDSVFNYVEGLDLDLKQREKLYNKFSGFKVYKNGTVKY